MHIEEDLRRRRGYDVYKAPAVVVAGVVFLAHLYIVGARVSE